MRPRIDFIYSHAHNAPIETGRTQMLYILIAAGLLEMIYPPITGWLTIAIILPMLIGWGLGKLISILAFRRARA